MENLKRKKLPCAPGCAPIGPLGLLLSLCLTGLKEIQSKTGCGIGTKSIWDRYDVLSGSSSYNLDFCNESSTDLNVVFRKGHYDVRYLAMDVVIEASENPCSGRMRSELCSACREVDV
ncbi:hypothetical protein HJFPF1_08403 [Paramyrothecium foliicola]|nr:hypothetical protein HJFPF1_08403 [Paramyrothecium foliicola]